MTSYRILSKRVLLRQVRSKFCLVLTRQFLRRLKFLTCLKLLLVSEGHLLGDLLLSREFVAFVFGLVVVGVDVVVVLLGDGLLTRQSRLPRGTKLLFQGIEPGLKNIGPV